MAAPPAEAAKELSVKDAKEAKEKEATAAKDRAAALPEVEVYLHLLILIFLLGQQRHEEATVVANSLIERIQSFNRVTLNLLSARAYFYYSRSYELVNKLDQIRPYVNLESRGVQFYLGSRIGSRAGLNKVAHLYLYPSLA
jgi:hypothetical protein